MSADQPANSFKHVLATAREYLTHWFIAGVIVTLTGFAPDHWFAHLFHAADLDGLREALPTIDYRLIVVGLGVLVSTVAVILQMSRMQRQQPAVAPVTFVAPTAAPLSAPAEEVDAIKDKPSSTPRAGGNNDRADARGVGRMNDAGRVRSLRA